MANKIKSEIRNGVEYEYYDKDAFHSTDATLTQAGQAADAKAAGDQLNQLNSSLVLSSDLSAILWEFGSFDATTGKPSGTSNTRLRSDYVHVKAGDVVSVSGNTSCLTVYKYGRDKSFISNTEWVNSYEIPSGTHYIRFLIRKTSWNSAMTESEIPEQIERCSVKTVFDLPQIDAEIEKNAQEIDSLRGDTSLKVGEIKSTIDDIQASMGVLRSYEQSVTRQNGKYINGSGVISDVENNGYKVTDYISVDGYYQAIVTGSAGTNLLMCAFYDETYSFISGVQGVDAAVSNQTVLIPANAKYLAIANDTRNTSSCTLTKWTYPYVQEFQTGHREYTAVWEQGTIDASGQDVYNKYPAKTGYLSTDDYDYIKRTSAIKEGRIYYYTYDPDTSSYVFHEYFSITPDVVHVLNKSYTHFRLRLFESWSDVVDLDAASEAFRLYRYVSTAERPKWFGKKWAAIGDSLTEINNSATAKYHDLISQKTGVTVVNLGDGGTGYKATDSGKGDSFMDRVANVPLDSNVITIFGSGNDLGAENEIGNVTDTGTTTLCGCINTTIDNLLSRMPLANIGIITPTPWQQYNPSNASNKMALYSEAIVEICKNKGIPCLDLYHCSGLRPWDSTFKTLAYANSDGVHPNNLGHELIAAKIEAFLDTLLLH